MPDNYDLPTDEVIDRLDRIERRLDLMGQQIAFLNGAFGQMDKRMDFLENTVFGPKKQADLPPNAYTRSTRRFIRICQVMIVVQVLFVILLQLL